MPRRSASRRQRVSVDFLQVHAHVQRRHRRHRAERFEGALHRPRRAGDRGRGALHGRRTVAVGDEIEIKARRFVIATGSSPALPPIPGLAETPYLTNETVFDLTDCPQHLIVIGAGPIGLEAGAGVPPARRRRDGAGSGDSRSPRTIPNAPRSCSTSSRAKASRSAPASRSNAVVRGRQGQVVLGRGRDGEERPSKAAILLVAAGRRPNVEGLDLDAAGIRYEPRGIVVDKRLRTTNKRVYAIGDVAGGAAVHPRRQLSRRPRHPERAVPPAGEGERRRDPVGHLHRPGTGPCRPDRSAGARAPQAIRVLRWPYHENDRAQAERATHGHIKVVTDRRRAHPGRHHRRRPAPAS